MGQNLRYLMNGLYSASKRDCGRPCEPPRYVWIRALGILLVSASVGGSCWADDPLRRGLDHSQTLCVPAERVYFSCQIGRKTVSLCGSDQITKTSGYLQYRFGRIGKEPELIYPPTQTHPRGQFRDSLVMSAQSYSYEIGFQRGEYSYRIFADSAARAQSYGWGIFVSRGEEPSRMLSCTGQIFEDSTTLSRMYDQAVLERLPGEAEKHRYILPRK